MYYAHLWILAWTIPLPANHIKVEHIKFIWYMILDSKNTQPCIGLSICYTSFSLSILLLIKYEGNFWKQHTTFHCSSLRHLIFWRLPEQTWRDEPTTSRLMHIHCAHTMNTLRCVHTNNDAVSRSHPSLSDTWLDCKLPVVTWNSM